MHLSSRDSIAWKKSVALASKVYAATRQFPIEERSGLDDQLRRSALAIATAIAEAAARNSSNDVLQSLRVARGCLAELEALLAIATDLRLIQHDFIAAEDVLEMGVLVNGKITALAQARQAAHAKACSFSQARSSRLIETGCESHALHKR